MSMSIKLVLTDLDGTLVRKLQHELSPKVQDAIRSCENATIKVCAVTGRTFEYAKNVLVAMGCKDPCIVNGGATIRDPITGEVLWHKWLAPEAARRITELFLPHCSLIDCSPVSNPQTPDGVVPSTITEEIPDVWAAVPPEKAEALQVAIAKIPDVVVHMIGQHGDDPNQFGMQVTHKNADKFHGVRALLDIMHVQPDEVLGIGDGDNDAPLLAAAGIKVVMGNAGDLLKAAADYVVASVDNDGFAEAIERFVLPKKG
jgi:HAD superfamily hydrolase (TIGR01484 family)